MNSKERMIAALCLEEPDKVPYMDTITSIVIKDRILKKSSTSSLFQTVRRQAPSDAYTAHMKNVEENIAISKAVGMDTVIINDSECVSKGYKYKVLPDPQGRLIIQDQMGRIYLEGEGGERWYKDGIIKKPEDFDNYEFPDLEAPGKFDVIKKAVDLVGDEMFIIGSVHWGFNYAWELVGGMEKLFLYFYLNPGFAKNLLNKINKYMVEIAKIMMDLGVDAIHTRDDLAGTDGSLFSPKIFDEFIMPLVHNLTNTVKKRGSFLVMHSDGDLYQILEKLIDAGIDCFNPVEPAVMDLKTCKERYGDRIALSGNVDCATTLVNGTPKDTREEVKRCIEVAAAGGGYVLSSSNSIYHGCRFENYVAMIGAKEEYGYYPLIL